MKKFNVGEYAYDSWGYDQTNIDFYKVVKRTEKTIWLQPVKGAIEKAEHSLAEYVVPSDEVETYPIIKYERSGSVEIAFREDVPKAIKQFRISRHSGDEEMLMSAFGIIRPYDNRPKLQTHYH